MTTRLRVIHYGLGPIGVAVARHVLQRPGLKIVGAVDTDPVKAGKDLAQLIGLEQPLDIIVQRALSDVLKNTVADLVLHTTNSYMDLCKPQIMEILRAGLDIVSTAEELSFPWLAHPEEAVELDTAAKQAGKTVLATGVNPGFLMDSLPLNLTAICQRIDRITVDRVVNASKRRGAFQKKIGSGLTVQEFSTLMAKGRIGHVGLAESTGMLFDTLGIQLVKCETTVEPVVAETQINTEFIQVAPGFVRGLRQIARGYSIDGEFVTLAFTAALDAACEQDTLHIYGQPSLEVQLKGINGDVATVAIAVNAVRRVHEAAPGLVTMRDLPLVTYW